MLSATHFPFAMRLVFTNIAPAMPWPMPLKMLRLRDLVVASRRTHPTHPHESPLNLRIPLLPRGVGTWHTLAIGCLCGTLLAGGMIVLGPARHVCAAACDICWMARVLSPISRFSLSSSNSGTVRESTWSWIERYSAPRVVAAVVLEFMRTEMETRHLVLDRFA